MKPKIETEKHTPTPWTLLSDRDGTFTMSYFRNENESLDIAEGLSKENAEFIVRAVNSHEALLEATKFALENLSPKGDVRKDYSGHLAKATLSKAIALAEGK